MRKDKEKAFKLRLQGKSYTEIQRILEIPKSTLSGWFASLELSYGIRQHLLARTQKKSIDALLRHNKAQTQKARERAHIIRSNAQKEIPMISLHNLFFIGVALYWAEGYKRPIRNKQGKEVTHHPVSFTNSDPDLVKIFLRFLREICKVQEEKITGDIRIFEHHNANTLLQFWQKITRIPVERFGKIYYGVSKSSLGKRPFNVLPYGTIQVRVNDTKLFHCIMGWIEGVKKFSK